MLIGLTGGIASGKSTVAALFEKMGLKIVDADKIAREIVQPPKPALKQIANRFGPAVLRPNGTLDREKLAAIIFNDKAAKEALNNITHPIILAEMQRKTAAIAKNYSGPVIWDVPLLFEANFAPYVDAVILVYVPEEIQLKRLTKRDGLTLAEARSRLDSQMPLQQKKYLATIIIDNSGTLKEVEEQVRLAYLKIINFKKDY